MAQNRNAGEKKEGSGSVISAHRIIRGQSRAAEFRGNNSNKTIPSLVELVTMMAELVPIIRCNSRTLERAHFRDSGPVSCALRGTFAYGGRSRPIIFCLSLITYAPPTLAAYRESALRPAIPSRC
ncbi:hypothetical protein EVAR_35624_1 [Eumeta japonica]|uniref:Uncharacterized protein n=1 Tax=Eumeta variegata TaxID=151549 RepID=A0A4C1WEU1_EUMVA|nr:hypothetical protein EVAR_35624_1 [Eumeta japonica]